MTARQPIYGHLAVLKLLQILAYDDTINNAAKRVFGLLSGHANKDGTCFPSIKKMAQSLCFSRTAISKQIKILEEHGYLKREERFDANRSRRPNIIVFNIDMANEYHETPDIFCRANVTLVVTYLATLLHYSAMQPFPDTWNGTSESCTKRKFENKNIKTVTVNRTKVSANSWEGRKTWERDMGITLEIKDELSSLQGELKKLLSHDAMVEFGISVGRQTKGMEPKERVEQTLELPKAQLSTLLAKKEGAGGGVLKVVCDGMPDRPHSA